MLRYYVAAAAIVVLFGAIVFARRLVAGDLDVRGGPAAPPRAQDSAAPNGAPSDGRFSADAPWALSALPGCYDQRKSIDGPADEVPAPRGERARAGTTLRTGECTIVVGEHDLWVFRGRDRLHVPPESALYREPDGRLALDVVARGRRTVRTYALRGDGSAPASK